MATQAVERPVPDELISPQEQKEILEIYRGIRELEAKLIGPDGKAEILPHDINKFLYELLTDLKAGYSVTLLQLDAALTTTDASKLLGMSRQFLITLLEKGAIKYHMVGTHRRIYARDVFAYKAKRDTDRMKALDDLARAEAEEGLYKVPDDFNAGQ